MKKVALLVFGQFRTASLILENNLKEIKKSFNNQTDFEYPLRADEPYGRTKSEVRYHLYILTDREPNGNYSELTLNRVQNICSKNQFEINLISYWDDLVEYHQRDKEITRNYIAIGEGKAGYGEKMWFTANMWYRRYVLWKLFLATSTEEYDHIICTRLFDVKIVNLRPILNLTDEDTLYFHMDSLFYGKKEILNLFYNSFNSFDIWVDFEWTEQFFIDFASFDVCLATLKHTFCSEAQVFNFIWRTFPKWKNIKWDYNAIDSPSHKDSVFHIFHIQGRETFRDTE